MSAPGLLRGIGNLRAVDLALAETLHRRDPSTPDIVLAAAALASFAVSQGHAAFDPEKAEELAGRGGLPPAGEWIRALQDSPWVAVAKDDAESDPSRPLVLEHGLVYLRRYREYERRLATGLARLAAQPGDAQPVPDAVFAALFPPEESDPAQAAAARLALARRLALVTGGPGTGKTTTIARVLLLLLARAKEAGQATPRIALAAPTGRAAERMAESLRLAAARFRGRPGIDDALLGALPREAVTLHRLLGAVPDDPQVRFGPGRPLPYDVVVVDEASMVDLPLMCKLVEAVADGARLVLLGDPYQLPSVEAGNVLAAIADATGDGGDRARSPLSGHRVHLQRGWRQQASLELAPLSEAVRRGDADAVLELLRGGALSGVHFREDQFDPLRGSLRERLLPGWLALQRCTDPVEALRLATRQRLLTVLRDGPQGAGPLNGRIEALLAGPNREPWFHGRLLLITRNSRHHRLSNGDIGICLRDEKGALVAWFPEGHDGARGFHPTALPAHESAFAMTVHKAQGSEFDAVWLQLPAHPNRVLSRELVYTAITRARGELHVAGGEAVIRLAVGRHAERWSGLGRRLRGGSA